MWYCPVCDWEGEEEEADILEDCTLICPECSCELEGEF